jgi:hypothetical protein
VTITSIPIENPGSSLLLIDEDKSVGALIAEYCTLGGLSITMSPLFVKHPRLNVDHSRGLERSDPRIGERADDYLPKPFQPANKAACRVGRSSSLGGGSSDQRRVVDASLGLLILLCPVLRVTDEVGLPPDRVDVGPDQIDRCAEMRKSNVL